MFRSSLPAARSSRSLLRYSSLPTRTALPSSAARHSRPYSATARLLEAAPVSPATTPAKPHRLRKFLTYLLLTTAAAYSGGVYLSLKSDAFHDVFAEHVPLGEDAVLFFEERDFRRRFPNAARRDERERERERERVLVKPQSGLEPDVAKKQEEKAKEDKASKPVEKVVEEAKPKQETHDDSQDGDKQQLRPSHDHHDPGTPTEDPEIARLLSLFDALAGPLSSSDPAYTPQLTTLRTTLTSVIAHLRALHSDAQAAAHQEIQSLHAQFDASATQLLKRVEELRKEDAASFREDFEAERERLARGYDGKLAAQNAAAQATAGAQLRNELVAQAIEMNRRFVERVQELVERERGGRLSRLAELTRDVGELEKITAGWAGVVGVTMGTQRLAVAVDALKSKIEGYNSEGGGEEDDDDDVPRPFIRELAAVQAVAGADDPVIAAAVASIPPEAYQRGIPSRAQLVARFRRVAAEVRKAALLPADAGITSHAASLVLSKVLFRERQGRDERKGEGEVEGVLVRTMGLLEEGRVEEAAREVNGLKGWAKVLSRDWLGDCRRWCEVRQAVEVLEAEGRLRTLAVDV